MAELAKDAHWEHRRKLAIFCRVAAMQGYIGTFGHISIRVPDTDIVLVTPGAGAEKTTARADQIFVYDIHGKLLHHPGGELAISEPAEYPIHTRLHRDRPEMLSVAHLHAPHSTLLGLVNRPILPAFNQAFYLYRGVPTWDNPQLVLTDEQAAPLSETLGDKIACQMRGHGSVVVGETPEVALMNCYTVEENAKYQIAAEPFGGAVPFPQSLIEETAAQRARMSVAISRILWTYFERRVTMTGLPI
jgi:ribulose-5-phosphate 4-epimerase/fuculose-1-phosphate aldolase